MNFSINGLYGISSNSSMDTFGYIYNNSFDPLTPSMNLVSWANDGDDNQQFQMVLNYKADFTVILVVTTNTEAIAGPFSVIARGPGTVTFTQLKQPGL